MTTALSDGIQIVPGYRLDRRLGKGGFGEVWRAIGPGKVPVAMKIIEAKGSVTGDREFRSLALLRDLRHPNLLPIQAFWLLDEDGEVIEDDDPKPAKIVIAMLLAGKSLRQRLEECRGERMAGIPPRELLEYMRDAAKGIDFLNKPVHQLDDRVVAIQHRDIKPENLMIVGGGVMVVDFGIAGVMESTSSHTTNAAMTCNYAAPELFDHTATAWTDQYALAITYSELRTGDLPFPHKSTMMQVIRIHTESKHDFSMLSPGEQLILQRATSAVPSERFPSCQAMIAELDATIQLTGLLDEKIPLLPESLPDTVPNFPSHLVATRAHSIDDISEAPTTPILETSERISSRPVVQANSTSATEVSADATTPNLSTPPTELTASTPMLLRRPLNQSCLQPASKMPAYLGGAVVSVVLLSLAAWGLRTTSQHAGRNQNPFQNSETEDRSITSPPVSSQQPLSGQATEMSELKTARENASLAARKRQFADVVKFLAPLFEQSLATSDDLLLRANSYFALAEADESPAENYANAAADYATAELPREQLRALTRQGRWLLSHNFPQPAVTVFRAALELKRSPDLSLGLCEALLANKNPEAARDEANATLSELTTDSVSDAENVTVARLHHVAARATLMLAKADGLEASQTKLLDALDREAEQHFETAIRLAAPHKLDEQPLWREELATFRQQPRMVARAESRERQKQISDLTQLTDRNEDDFVTLLKLAELEKQDGQVKLADSHFARAFGLQAVQFLRAGMLENAIAAEKMGSQHDATDRAVHHAQALIAQRQGRLRDAISLLNVAIQNWPKKSSLRWQLLSDRAACFAQLAIESPGSNSDWQNARSDFDAAIEQFPGSLASPDSEADVTTAHRSLAQLHHDRAMWLETFAFRNSTSAETALIDSAEESYLLATRWNPSSFELALAAGRYLIRLSHRDTPDNEKRLERSAELLRTAIKLHDREPESHFSLGECLLLQGKITDAQAAFDRTVELASEAAPERQFQFHLTRSTAYLLSPRNDEAALASAVTAIALRRSEAAPHFVRGMALKNLKRNSEALAAFTDAINVQPKQANALLGRALLVIEDSKSERKQLDQANIDIETAFATAMTPNLKAEAHYVRSLASLKMHVANVTQIEIAEPALLMTERDLIDAVNLLPSNKTYQQAASELFEYAARFQWSNTQRKSESSELIARFKSRRSRE